MRGGRSRRNKSEYQLLTHSKKKREGGEGRVCDIRKMGARVLQGAIIRVPSYYTEQARIKATKASIGLPE